MRQAYVILLGVLGVATATYWDSFSKALYVTSGVAIALALISSISPKLSLVSNWWNLTPMAGLFLAGLLFELTESLLLSIGVMIAAVAVHFFFGPFGIVEDVEADAGASD
jgi:hypothetical protein